MFAVDDSGKYVYDLGFVSERKFDRFFRSSAVASGPRAKTIDKMIIKMKHKRNAVVINIV